MKFLRIAIPASILMTACPVAFAAEPTLPGKPSTVHDAYNKTAEMLNKPQRLKLLTCDQEAARTCSYSLNGSDTLIAASLVGQFDDLQSVTMFFAPTQQPTLIAATMRILMSTYSPNSTSTAIDKAISHFRNARDERLQDNRYVLGSTHYTIWEADIVTAVTVQAERD